MMGNSTGMSTPVTRGELREELAQFETRLEQKLEQKLELWGGALLARIEATNERIDGLEQRLLAELARHTKAIQESFSAQIAIVDEKYADLPGRMSRLEAADLPDRVARLKAMVPAPRRR